MKKGPKPSLKWSGAFSSAITENGELLACAGRRGASVFDLRSSGVLFHQRPFPNASRVGFSPDGKLLVVKNTGGRIALLDARSGEIVHRLPDGGREGCAPAFAGDGKHLIDGNWDGDLRLLTLKGELVRTKNHPNEMISCISHDRLRGLFLVLHKRKASRGGSEPLPDYFALHDGSAWRQEPRIFEFGKSIEVGMLSPDAQWIAYTERWKGIVHIARVLDGKTVASSTPIELGGSGRALAWAPDCRYVAVNARHGFTILETGALGAVGGVVCKYPSCVAFHPDGTSIVLSTWERSHHIQLDALIGAMLRL